ncbi:hypothetical protein L218DRAFT_1002505 [Marasmius fiardii PR-910]|nr:hypothetical protein L218DRAFT_1002505 [Marasmius fiardii PR-910]
MAFVGATQFSIEGDTNNYVQGDQIINYLPQTASINSRKRKRTIHDEFEDIQRGNVYRIRDLHRIDGIIRPKFYWYEAETLFEAERTISTAEIQGNNSRFTVVSYRGKDAKKAWEEEFRQWSENTDATNMQLFGINRSDVPLLIFHRELLPLMHFMGRIGKFGQLYASTLARTVMECPLCELWMDPKQGTLIRGVEGSRPDRYYYSFDHIRNLPSSVELLREDVCFRFFAQLPLNKAFDNNLIEVLYWMYSKDEILSEAFQQPHVSTDLNNRTIRVRGGKWSADIPSKKRPKASRSLIMADGRLRFSVKSEDDNFWSSDIFVESYPHQYGYVWLSQASSLGITPGDLSHFNLIAPRLRLRARVDHSTIARQRRSESSPIYLFVEPLHRFSSIEKGTPTSLHTWSSDENGQNCFSDDHCRYLGLPTELQVTLCRMNLYTWPNETYKTIHEWQIARGFDPTTTDFARYLGFPTLEVTPSEPLRFEELHPGLILWL